MTVDDVLTPSTILIPEVAAFSPETELAAGSIEEEKTADSVVPGFVGVVADAVAVTVSSRGSGIAVPIAMAVCALVIGRRARTEH